jgi:hypothetical protein
MSAQNLSENGTDQPAGKPDAPTSVTEGPPVASDGSQVDPDESRLAALERRLAALEQHPSITGIIDGVKHEWCRTNVVLDASPACVASQGVLLSEGSDSQEVRAWRTNAVEAIQSLRGKYRIERRNLFNRSIGDDCECDADAPEFVAEVEFGIQIAVTNAAGSHNGNGNGYGADNEAFLFPDGVVRIELVTPERDVWIDTFIPLAKE